MSNTIKRYRYLAAATEGLKLDLSDRTAIIEDVLTRVVIDTIRRYQQKINVGIQDSVSDLLATFKLKVAEEVFRVSQNWMLATHRDPILFPPDCRFLYTLGSSSIVVIEQSPGVRSLRFDTALLGQSRVNERTNTTQIRALSLPYTIFVLHCKNTNVDGTGREQFCNLYIGWRCTPLSSLKDDIYYTFLPNIHQDNYTVCTGSRSQRQISTMTGGAGVSELTNNVITEFWGSTFNTDLSHWWWNKPLSVQEWEQKSRHDPLFILSMPFQKPIPLDGLIKQISTASEGSALETIDLRHQITEKTDELAERLFQGIKNYIHKTKFDRFYPKDITNNLSDAMDGMAKQLQAIAFDIEMRLDDMADELHQLRQSDYRWKKRGPHWQD